MLSLFSFNKWCRHIKPPLAKSENADDRVTHRQAVSSHVSGLIIGTHSMQEGVEHFFEVRTNEVLRRCRIGRITLKQGI